MKTILCIALFAALAVVAFAEDCRVETTCKHVTCPESDYVLDCAHGACTCTHTTRGCSSQQDCTGIGNCPPNRVHCLDKRCRCGFGIFGGGNN